MTVTFWAIVSAMTVAVLGLLVRPLLKRPAQLTSEQEKTLPVYRQQFSELEQDLTNGLLTDDQYQTARHELERRVLEETGSTDTSSMMSGGLVNLRLVALSLVLVIPAASGVLYWTLGNPAAMTHPAVAASSSQGGPGDDPQMADSLNQLIEQLRKKLEQNPNDGVGWGLLARSYMAMERYADAVPIFEKATKLDPDNASLLADYADALGVHQGRKLEGRPEALIQKALKVDPHNVKALMLSGTLAYNRKDFSRAAKEWEDAHAYLPPDDQESADQLKASIAEAKRRLGGGPSMGMMVANPPMEQAKPAKPSAQSGQPRAITGKVVLGPNMAGKALPDTLFVFAKDVAGPPMPVSIVRASRKDLPFTFRLDDSTSPMPSRKLSDIDTVVIVARLSKSGKAMAESGDLEGMSQPIKPGAENITVVIDRERP
ncbi:c-type cytochrome biogenesis protein CcmI [Candidatus Nitrospira nitrificans]|uniref:Cytochrome c-type biogenesis protein CcmI n=1 Tax=Candidatus Nitrospira nitrificans TaxID=1742973 RepID=A0A0S4LRL3_9BACT|nr:c-type cytochrome biogenesis protein CcmI [Candidatus Nitrospira nitrificans]CUS38619.1 Cytochrome c-type biogenesis protein CcmI [Candidatus Nitrospira nitrificans]